MGLKDRIKKFDKDKFRPEILDEATVQTLFNRCISTDKSSNNLHASVLFKTELGYEEDSAPIFFSLEQLNKNKKTIDYILGQLKNVHTGNIELTIQSAIIDYTGSIWTKDPQIIMELLHLGESIRSIEPFVAKYQSTVYNTRIKPTLSPEDPNFEKWYADHKGEWEDVKAGQKPFAEHFVTKN